MIIVDTETTGVHPEKHSLLSIGAIDFSNPQNRFYGECRAYDGAHMSDEAFAINGFTRESATNQSKMTDRELVERFIDWTRGIADTTMAGESPSFDRDFIRSTCERYGLNWPFAYRTVDLHSVAYAHLTRKGESIPSKNGHSDQGLSKTLALVGMTDIRKAHNALEDALLEAEAFSRLISGKKLLQEYARYDLPKGL